MRHLHEESFGLQKRGKACVKGYSNYDFSDIRSTLDAFRIEQADQRWIVDEHNAQAML